MLKPTALGRFGNSFLTHVSEGSPDAFRQIRAQVLASTDADNLRGGAGDLFGDARVEVIVSTLRAPMSNGDENDDSSSLFVGLSISDPTGDASPDTPRFAPTSEEPEEVDFGGLLSAVADVLPGRQALFHRSHLVVGADDADLAFTLPMNFWRSSPPFGSLVGVRFELNARGVRDGWITLDSRDDEVFVGMTFERDLELSIDSIAHAWEFIRRTYDKAIVPRSRRGGMPQ